MIISGERRISYPDIQERVARAASGFKALGVRDGAPVGLMTMLEFTAFGVTGVMMGWFGEVPMAGHQIALNLASFTFMVPLGIASSGSVLVGHAVGRGDIPGARRESGAALVHEHHVAARSDRVRLVIRERGRSLVRLEPDRAAGPAAPRH